MSAFTYMTPIHLKCGCHLWTVPYRNGTMAPSKDSGQSAYHVGYTYGIGRRSSKGSFSFKVRYSGEIMPVLPASAFISEIMANLT